uniref:FAM193 C-terminal domain-containing protein n=1 Tax=Sinocyclocheilus grahami TaxID=75366 RepID=A0A672Q6B3_SINGR
MTSRLEEIKNTIKDSIRASFSMYDLNLDVNDFPKKAATLEGNHLLSHLNGSSDLQQIDLDLAPLSLRNFKRDLDIVNGWEDTTTAAKDIQRLHSTPSLSKLIRVQSPERSPPTTGAGSKTKKGKKQQNQRHQEQATQEQVTSIKMAKTEMHKAQETRAADSDKSTKGGSKQNHQTQQQAYSQKTGNKRAEEVKACKQSSNGQPKGKTKNKNKNKTEKSNNAIDDVFLPKDVDPTEMDEIDREVEYFKRFCLDSAKQTRQKVAVNWSNFSLKKMPSNAAQ